MLQLGESAELRRSVGAAAEIAIAPYSPETWAREFEAIVDRLASPRKTS
jgi:hypothetical protein